MSALLLRGSAARVGGNCPTGERSKRCACPVRSGKTSESFSSAAIAGDVQLPPSVDRVWCQAKMS